MKSITSKLVIGMLTSLAATGMTGGAAFAEPCGGTEGCSSHVDVMTGQSTSEMRDEAVGAARERRQQAGHIIKDPQSITYKVTGRVSYARAVVANVAREAQR